MAYALRVLCRPEVAAGFALAGLRPVEASTPAAGAAAVRDLLAQPDVGVALVQDTFYEALPADLRRPGGAEAYIVELLRQVIGYRVRLK
jgi:vacuolar-type H+-ATPase subunit F/Vma7